MPPKIMKVGSIRKSQTTRTNKNKTGQAESSSKNRKENLFHSVTQLKRIYSKKENYQNLFQSSSNNLNDEKSKTDRLPIYFIRSHRQYENKAPILDIKKRSNSKKFNLKEKYRNISGYLRLNLNEIKDIQKMKKVKEARKIKGVEEIKKTPFKLKKKKKEIQSISLNRPITSQRKSKSFQCFDQKMNREEDKKKPVLNWKTIHNKINKIKSQNNLQPNKNFNSVIEYFKESRLQNRRKKQSKMISSVLESSVFGERGLEQRSQRISNENDKNKNQNQNKMKNSKSNPKKLSISNSNLTIKINGFQSQKIVKPVLVKKNTMPKISSKNSIFKTVFFLSKLNVVSKSRKSGNSKNSLKDDSYVQLIKEKLKKMKFKQRDAQNHLQINHSINSNPHLKILQSNLKENMPNDSFKFFMNKTQDKSTKLLVSLISMIEKSYFTKQAIKIKAFYKLCNLTKNNLKEVNSQKNENIDIIEETNDFQKYFMNISKDFFIIYNNQNLYEKIFAIYKSLNKDKLANKNKEVLFLENKLTKKNQSFEDIIKNSSKRKFKFDSDFNISYRFWEQNKKHEIEFLVDLSQQNIMVPENLKNNKNENIQFKIKINEKFSSIFSGGEDSLYNNISLSVNKKHQSYFKKEERLINNRLFSSQKKKNKNSWKIFFIFVENHNQLIISKFISEKNYFFLLNSEKNIYEIIIFSMKEIIYDLQKEFHEEMKNCYEDSYLKLSMNNNWKMNSFSGSQKSNQINRLFQQNFHKKDRFYSDQEFDELIFSKIEDSENFDPIQYLKILFFVQNHHIKIIHKKNTEIIKNAFKTILDDEISNQYEKSFNFEDMSNHSFSNSSTHSSCDSNQTNSEDFKKKILFKLNSHQKSFTRMELLSRFFSIFKILFYTRKRNMIGFQLTQNKRLEIIENEIFLRLIWLNQQKRHDIIYCLKNQIFMAGKLQNLIFSFRKSKKAFKWVNFWKMKYSLSFKINEKVKNIDLSNKKFDKISGPNNGFPFSMLNKGFGNRIFFVFKEIYFFGLQKDQKNNFSIWNVKINFKDLISYLFENNISKKKMIFVDCFFYSRKFLRLSHKKICLFRLMEFLDLNNNCFVQNYKHNTKNVKIDSSFFDKKMFTSKEMYKWGKGYMKIYEFNPLLRSVFNKYIKINILNKFSKIFCLSSKNNSNNKNWKYSKFNLEKKKNFIITTNKKNFKSEILKKYFLNKSYLYIKKKGILRILNILSVEIYKNISSLCFFDKSEYLNLQFNQKKNKKTDKFNIYELVSISNQKFEAFKIELITHNFDQMISVNQNNHLSLKFILKINPYGNMQVQIFIFKNIKFLRNIDTIICFYIFNRDKFFKMILNNNDFANIFKFQLNEVIKHKIKLNIIFQKIIQKIVIINKYLYSKIAFEIPYEFSNQSTFLEDLCTKKNISNRNNIGSNIKNNKKENFFKTYTNKFFFNKDSMFLKNYIQTDMKNSCRNFTEKTIKVHEFGLKKVLKLNNNYVIATIIFHLARKNYLLIIYVPFSRRKFVLKIEFETDSSDFEFEMLNQTMLIHQNNDESDSSRKKKSIFSDQSGSNISKTSLNFQKKDMNNSFFGQTVNNNFSFSKTLNFEKTRKQDLIKKNIIIDRNKKKLTNFMTRFSLFANSKFQQNSELIDGIINDFNMEKKIDLMNFIHNKQEKRNSKEIHFEINHNNEKQKMSLFSKKDTMKRMNSSSINIRKNKINIFEQNDFQSYDELEKEEFFHENDENDENDEKRRIGILETKNHMSSLYEKFLRSQCIWNTYLTNFQLEEKYSNILLKNHNFRGILREIISYDFDGKSDIITEIFMESINSNKNIFQPFKYEVDNFSMNSYLFIKITYIGDGVDNAINLNDKVSVFKIIDYFSEEYEKSLKIRTFDLKFYIVLGNLIQNKINQVVSFYDSKNIFSKNQDIYSNHFISKFLIFHSKNNKTKKDS